jgi:hypothetical protein
VASTSMSSSVVTASTTVVARPDLLTAEFGSEVIVLNLQSGVYYGLEDVGARIWTLLRSPVSVATIVETVLSDYDVDSADCEHDIRLLVDDLVAHGLVRIHEVP